MHALGILSLDSILHRKIPLLPSLEVYFLKKKKKIPCSLNKIPARNGEPQYRLVIQKALTTRIPNFLMNKLKLTITPFFCKT